MGIFANVTSTVTSVRSEVLDIADGRTADDLRQRSERADEATQYADGRYSNALEHDKKLTAYVRAHMLRLILRHMTETGAEVFDRAAFSEAYVMPRTFLQLMMHPGGRRRSRG